MKIKFVLLALLFLLTAPAISSGAQKIITDYTGDRIIGVQQPNTITFDKDMPDFTFSPSTTGAVSVDLINKTADLGNSIANSCGVLWYEGTNPLVGNCVNGICNFDTGFRAYFEFTATADTSTNSDARGQGFTFTVMNGANNTRDKRGGSPTGSTGLEALMCYAGPGNTSTTDELGLEPPKMAIEFDTWPNRGSYTSTPCTNNNRYDANNQNNYNHTALVFWGVDLSGSCGSYERISYDDNVHYVPTTGSTTNPRNSYRGDGTGGYYERARSTYNWMEDGLTHKVRIEVTRATTAATLGCTGNTYAYNVKAWVDCALYNTPYTACSASELVYFQDVFNAYNNNSYLPKINRTVCLSNATATPLHNNFSTMLFGFTQATGTLATAQNIQIKNFVIYFTSGYTWCAYEDPTPGAPGPFYCSFSGTRTVAYGANGVYNYMYNATSPVHCNNATFGDPLVGTLKNCYYK